MSSNQGNVDFIVEQMAGAGAVSAKKMFGEYGVFCDGKMVAIIADDQLFVKPTSASIPDAKHLSVLVKAHEIVGPWIGHLLTGKPPEGR